MAFVQSGRPVAHVCLDQLEHLAGFLLDSPVAGDQHGFLNGAAVPRQHISDGDAAAKQALSVLVKVLAGPVLHVGVRHWFAEGGVRVLVTRTRAGVGRRGTVVVVFIGKVSGSTTLSVMVILGRDVLLSFGFQCSCLETKKKRLRNKKISVRMQLFWHLFASSQLPQELESECVRCVGCSRLAYSLSLQKPGNGFCHGLRSLPK